MTKNTKSLPAPDTGMPAMRETLRTPVGDLILGAAHIRAEAEAYNGLHPVTGNCAAPINWRGGRESTFLNV